MIPTISWAPFSCIPQGFCLFPLPISSSPLQSIVEGRAVILHFSHPAGIWGMFCPTDGFFPTGAFIFPSHSKGSLVLHTSISPGTHSQTFHLFPHWPEQTFSCFCEHILCHTHCPPTTAISFGKICEPNISLCRVRKGLPTLVSIMEFVFQDGIHPWKCPR